MNLKKSQIEIIKLLISANNYISSYNIAMATGINRRLVRDEMINIKKILKELGFELSSKTSKGYIIEGKNPSSLQSLSYLIEQAEKERDTLFPTLPGERQNYIIRRILETDGYIKIDDLAEELLISRSTISIDLKHCRHNIKKYNLTLHQKPNYGICIVGDEVNRRKPICDNIFTNLNQSEMFYDYLTSFIVCKESLEYGILEIIKKKQIELSDIALCDFLLYLSVSITRILSGHSITSSPDLSPILGREEFEVAKDIALFIEEKEQCHINEFEINQIAIELICKRSTKGLVPKNNPKIIQIIDDILNAIKKQTLITLEDSSFYTIFTMHIENALLRIKYNEKIRNPHYAELKTAYPLAYKLAEISSDIIEKHTHQKLSMSELAFFAILFHTVIHNQHIRKKKVLLLCGLGGGYEDCISCQILERFENQINIVKTSQYYKLPDEDLSQYDIVISTVPIHRNLSIPHINISQLMTSDDLDKIDNHLSYLFKKNKLETLFLPQFYKANVFAKDKNDIAKEFYNILNIQYPLIKKSFINNLPSKEYSQLFYCNNNIGILKLNKPLNNNNILAVLIIPKGICWDQYSLKIIILFSCADYNHYIFNTLTNALNTLSVNSDTVNDIIQNPSYTYFLKHIIKYE